MNYLLTGAEFNNKGAEAMTLVALKNIFERDPNAEIYIFEYETTKLPFETKKEIHQVKIAPWQIASLLGKSTNIYTKIRIKDFIKFFVPGKTSFFGAKIRAKKVLKTIDMMIDISGFSFSSKWGDLDTVEFADKLYLLKKYGAKLYLMPQSFGPFDYKDKQVLEYGKKAVALCEKVYAREKDGYNLLLNMHLMNVELMPDSVLIEKDFDPRTVIKNYEECKETIITPDKTCIGIVPNYRLIDRGGFDHDQLLSFYCNVINKYKKSSQIYLIAHSGEDIILCNEIKEQFLNDTTVTLIDHVMLSFNYESFVKKLDFIIASRYHAIVHAYKECTPSVILGWADKYQDISSLMHQEQYMIDLDDHEKAIKAVDAMMERCDLERDVLKERLAEVQKYSCYECLNITQESM